MVHCSVCGLLLNQSVFRFEQCSAHLFCKGCFFIKNTIIGINCKDCSKVLNFKRQDKHTKNCFYCSGTTITLTCNNSHNICSSCIQNKEIDINCYECYSKFFTFSFCCQSFNNKQMPIPANPSKTMCLKCLTNKYLMDTQNQIRPYMNYCCLCKQNPITLKLCESHGFCIQCAIIVQLITDTEFYFPLIKCDICKYQIKQIDLENICSICGCTENELILIFACVKNHKSCKRCFIGQFNSSNLACRDCRAYFQLKKANKKNVCTICYYKSTNTPTKTCSIHYICNTCYQKKKTTPVLIFQKLIECQDCFHSSSLGIKNKSMNPIKNGICQICNCNEEFGCSCPRHEICKDCFRFAENVVKDFIGSCAVCLDIIGMACKICFEKSKKYRVIKCSFFHIYCNKCIKNENFFTRENKCNECTEIFRKLKQEQKSRCAQCQNIVSSNSVCKDHFICDICLPTPDIKIIEKVYECSECINNSNFICQRCNEKYNYKKSICLLDCQNLHLYCNTCFFDLKRISNIMSKCNRCRVVFQKDHYTKVKKLCSKCNSIESSPMICDTHDFCSMCYIKTDKHVIESCKTCSNNLAKICIICICLLTLLDKKNYNSKEGFYLCKNCQPKQIISNVKNKPKNEKQKSSEEGSRNWILNVMPKNLSNPAPISLSYYSNPEQDLSKYQINPESFPTQFPQLNPQLNPQFYQGISMPNNLYSQTSQIQNLDLVSPSQIDKNNANLKSTNYFHHNHTEVAYIAKSNTKYNHMIPNESPTPYNSKYGIQSSDLANINENPKFDKYVANNSNLVACSICRSLCELLSCKHANCSKCFNAQFIPKFKSFIFALETKNTLALENLSFITFCQEPSCKSKYNIPLNVFWDSACSIVSPYFNGHQQTIVNFLKHYEGFFQGLCYEFKFCENCYHLVGKAYNQKCLWCNH